MNFFKIFIILTALIASVIALPTIVDFEAEAHRADRQRRITCDLLRGRFGDAACAANCLSMGKAGGTCQDGICVCRRDLFKDLWQKRFGSKNDD